MHGARVLGLIALAALASPATAELIVLADGRTVQGDIVPPVDDQGFWLEKFSDGGRVYLYWQQLEPAAARLLRLQYGLDRAERAMLLVDAQRVTLTNGTVYDGLVEERENGQVRVLTRGLEHLLFRSQIESIEPVKVPALDIYPPDKVYALERARYPAQLSAGEEFELGELCLALELVDLAEQHFLAAKQGDPGLEIAVERALQQVEKLRARIALEAQLDAFKQLARQRRYGTALKGLADLSKAHRNEPIAQVADDLARRLTEEVRRELERQVPGLLKKVAADGVKDKDLTLAAARSFASGPLGNELVNQLSAAFDLSNTEVRKFWGEREKKRWNSVRYGDAAAFEGGALGKTAATAAGAGAAAEQPASGGGAAAPSSPQDMLKALSGGKGGDLKSMIEGLLGGGRSSGGSGGGAGFGGGGSGGAAGGGQMSRGQQAGGQQQTAQKRQQTPDEWWAKANSGKRRDYVIARFLEHGSRGLFDTEVEPTKTDKIVRYR